MPDLEIPMKAKDLKEYQAILDERRNAILDAARKAREEELAMDTDDLPDEMDLATAEYNQSLIFRLRGREKVLLKKIDSAIERIKNGEYGICEGCGGKISPKRLRARPVTTFCIECKESQEQTERGFR